MLGWIAMLILGIFLLSCGVAVCASCRQIFHVTFNSFNTPKGTRKIARPAEA
ncbi:MULTISPECIES: hypothetical protein [Desulfitobacterium]|uniref:Uncharacterized protein n=2 Tax=Desulfitobacterium dehalogenans TaxID=36854 RepID=I4AA78_DESDJ|nr:MULTISPECIES: hypothetical protein [Desulfitobacterium]AFM00863.1 hypothetical protein Desde_2533 [Desulfitobacterium dehalogenans ATCC 51507]HHY28751.1 hypothetical protein [Desulfitobacterium dehalogenans]